MKLFAYTFEGFATKFVLATDEDDARDKALKEAIEGNEIIITTDKLTIQEVS